MMRSDIRSTALIFSSLVSSVFAVTLGELGVPAPPSYEPTTCNDAYTSSIPQCTQSDFKDGCSALCRVGVSTTLDLLTLECGPGWVSTVLGSSQSAVGVTLLCDSPSLAKGSTTSKSTGGAAQTTSSLTSTTTKDGPLISSTVRETTATNAPIMSKGPPPNDTSSSPSTTILITSTLVESKSTDSGTTSSDSLITSSFLTRAPNPIPTRHTATKSSKTSSILVVPSSHATSALPQGGIGPAGSSGSQQSPVGAIVGGVLGGVASIALIISVLFYFLIRPLRRRQAEDDASYYNTSPYLDPDTLMRRDPDLGPRWSAANPYRPPLPPAGSRSPAGPRSPPGSKWSAANPYRPQPLPPIITRPYRSNSARSYDSGNPLMRHESPMSNRSIHRSNSLSSIYSTDRYGNRSPINRYDISPVAPLYFMEAEWNHLQGQPGPSQMRQASISRRQMFNQYPSMIEEERESYITASSVGGSIYELSADQSSSKVNVGVSDENRRPENRRGESKRTSTPEVPRRSLLRQDTTLAALRRSH